MQLIQKFKKRTLNRSDIDQFSLGVSENLGFVQIPMLLAHGYVRSSRLFFFLGNIMKELFLSNQRIVRLYNRAKLTRSSVLYSNTLWGRMKFCAK
jgi:hypothetical protein